MLPWSTVKETIRLQHGIRSPRAPWKDNEDNAYLISSPETNIILSINRNSKPEKCMETSCRKQRTANSPASNTELKHQITLQVLPTTISQRPITSFICKVCSQNLVRPGQGPDYTPPSDREKNTGTKMPKSSMPMYLYISNQHNTTEKKEPTNQEKVNES